MELGGMDSQRSIPGGGGACGYVRVPKGKSKSFGQSAFRHLDPEVHVRVAVEVRFTDADGSEVRDGLAAGGVRKVAEK